MPPGLLDMPEDVMIKIMEDIGIKPILHLRKVCHDLRNFIDDVKPDSKLEKIEVYVKRNNFISVEYTFREDSHLIEYEKRKKGCTVENFHRGSQKLFQTENFINVFMKDFEIVLQHQKSALKSFVVSAWRETKEKDLSAVMEHIERVLKSRDRPLKVEFFTAWFNQNQIMSILPFLDSKTLNRVKISNEDGKVEVDQLVKLNQWKSIQHLDLYRSCADFEYIQHFTHFSAGWFEFKTTNFPDLVSLKNLFLDVKSGFEGIIVSPTDFDFDDVHQSTHLLGEPFSKIEYGDVIKHAWYYRIPATNRILEIHISEGFQRNQIFIALSRIEESEVPPEAVIQNEMFLGS